MSVFQAKDFIETAEGLLFAVVSDGDEDGRVLCFLRYWLENALWRKVDSAVANQLLGRFHPQYLHFSKRLDARLHAVEQRHIIRHYQPRAILPTLLDGEATDGVIADLQCLCRLLLERGLPLDGLGVTGSILVGLQNPLSDIDLVIYDRALFHRARMVIRELIAEQLLDDLGDDDWLESYQRRGCDFAFADYVWHEKRKFNKALINGRKFDVSLLMPNVEVETLGGYKLGFAEIEARIIDDQLAFDYPARFGVDHDLVSEIVCFTATFSGQALCGEQVKAAGQLEVDALGVQRLVVGSSREAHGEYLRVEH